MTSFAEPRLDVVQLVGAKSDERGRETNDERPAVRAKGTVRPSEKPMIISRMYGPGSLCCSPCGITGAGAGISDAGSDCMVEVFESIVQIVAGLHRNVLKWEMREVMEKLDIKVRG